MFKLTTKRGFTLIELLVVITIIGILSAVLYANFGDARQGAKNKAIQSEMKEVQLAIELYKAQNKRYPEAQDISSSGCKSTAFGIDTSKTSACGNNPVIDGLVSEFIATLPANSDSSNSGCDFEYQVPTDGSWYKFTAVKCLSGATTQAEGIQSDDEFARCLTSCGGAGICAPSSADFYESYAVYSIGGECE